MKKVHWGLKGLALLIFAGVMIFSLAACGKDSKNNKYTNPPKSNGSNAESNTHTMTKEELNSITNYLEDAEEYASSIASTLLKKWTTDSYFAYFFDESKFKNSSAFSQKKDYVNVHKYRAQAEQALQEAKELIGTNGNGDVYLVTKNFYLAVNNYLSLVSEYPEGYSLVTYSAAVSDCQNECRSCRAELDFYLS